MLIWWFDVFWFGVGCCRLLWWFSMMLANVWLMWVLSWWKCWWNCGFIEFRLESSMCVLRLVVFIGVG